MQQQHSPRNGKVLLALEVQRLQANVREECHGSPRTPSAWARPPRGPEDMAGRAATACGPMAGLWGPCGATGADLLPSVGLRHGATETLGGTVHGAARMPCRAPPRATPHWGFRSAAVQDSAMDLTDLRRSQVREQPSPGAISETPDAPCRFPAPPLHAGARTPCSPEAQARPLIHAACSSAARAPPPPHSPAAAVRPCGHGPCSPADSAVDRCVRALLERRADPTEGAAAMQPGSPASASSDYRPVQTILLAWETVLTGIAAQVQGLRRDPSTAWDSGQAARSATVQSPSFRRWCFVLDSRRGLRAGGSQGQSSALAAVAVSDGEWQKFPQPP